MEEDLRSGIETLKDIAEGAVPPEISIEEAKAILKRYKELEEENIASKETINILTNKIEKVVDENKTLTDEYMIQKHLINADFLKDYISISVIQNKKKEEREKCVARFRYGNDEAPLESYKYKYTDIDMNEYAGSEIMRVLQEIIEEGRK